MGTGRRSRVASAPQPYGGARGGSVAVGRRGTRRFPHQPVVDHVLLSDLRTLLLRQALGDSRSRRLVCRRTPSSDASGLMGRLLLEQRSEAGRIVAGLGAAIAVAALMWAIYTRDPEVAPAVLAG